MFEDRREQHKYSKMATLCDTALKQGRTLEKQGTQYMIVLTAQWQFLFLSVIPLHSLSIANTLKLTRCSVVSLC